MKGITIRVHPSHVPNLRVFSPATRACPSRQIKIVIAVTTLTEKDD